MSEAKPLPSIERLAKIVNYDPITGVMTWSGNPSFSRYGKPVGSLRKAKNTYYIIVSIKYEDYYVHRLAWLLIHKTDPLLDDVDHIDGDGTNNKADNLRLVNDSVNRKNSRLSKNNSSGHNGVYYYKRKRKWTASIRTEGELVHLGYFDGKLKAIEARKEAERLYGFHETHGEIRVK